MLPKHHNTFECGEIYLTVFMLLQVLRNLTVFTWLKIFFLQYDHYHFLLRYHLSDFSIRTSEENSLKLLSVAENVGHSH